MFRSFVILFVLFGCFVFPCFGETSEAVDIPEPAVSVEILPTNLSSIEVDTALFIKIYGATVKDVEMSCKKGTTQIIESTDQYITLRWSADKTCRLPLMTIKGANYILPIKGFLPDLEVLADISTATLRNTLKSGQTLRSNVKLSGLHVRRFFSNINRVLTSRVSKFSLPIPTAPLPTKDTFLPNSLRPYRAGSTDGVHHGWDFYVPQGTEVLAIDDGIVLHVKDDFSWDEMDHLSTGKSDIDLQENLDVYRGNTVYLKTLSGHVAIYAHLNNLPPEIQPGLRVSRGTILGHVGDSAVPDKRYLYHLHFELAINPLQDFNAGTYSHNDILLWPWFGKGRGTAWIRDHDDAIFESIQ